MIKLIASDYDGTLRPEGAGNMSQEMKEYICCAMENGSTYVKEQAKYVTSTVEEVLRERIFGS